MTPASLGVLTFRRRGPAGRSDSQVDRDNEAVVATLAAAGDVLVTSTVIGGRYAIRLCVLNHSSGEADVRHALERVATVAVDAGATPDPATGRGARQAGVDLAWLDAPAVDAARLATMPLFEGTDPARLEAFLGTSREETYPAGTAVTQRWALARTFYLVLAGRLSVSVDGTEVNVLGPGDHLGEIAAIDWGRDFSYGRTATVVATDDARLLAFPAAALRELMVDVPAVDKAVRREAQSRLARR